MTLVKQRANRLDRLRFEALECKADADRGGLAGRLLRQWQDGHGDGRRRHRCPVNYAPRTLLTPSALPSFQLSPPSILRVRASILTHSSRLRVSREAARGVCSVPGAQTWLVSVISRKRGSRSDLEPLSCVRVTCPSYRACVCWRFS